MSLLAAILIGLGTGFVFGVALEKSRVFEPGIIIGQMQFKNFIMLKVFLAAVITGLVVLAAMNGLFGVKLYLKPLVWGADIIGGLLLGVGIVLAGACPGTTLAQVGAGYRDAWFVLLGGIVGAAVYGYFETSLFAAALPTKGEIVSFAGLLGLPFWGLALITAAFLVAVLIGLERWQSWSAEVGADYDGLPQISEHGVAEHAPASAGVAEGSPHPPKVLCLR
jgi:hypothetical protein